MRLSDSQTNCCIEVGMRRIFNTSLAGLLRNDFDVEQAVQREYGDGFLHEELCWQLQRLANRLHSHFVRDVIVLGVRIDLHLAIRRRADRNIVKSLFDCALGNRQ